MFKKYIILILTISTITPFPLLNLRKTQSTMNSESLNITTPTELKPTKKGGFYILYQIFVTLSGWTLWSKEGTIIGYSESNLKVLSLRIVSKIRIKYRAFKPNFWTNWIENGGPVCNEYEGGNLKGIQIKNIDPIDNDYIPFYRVHSPINNNWLDWNINGDTSGDLNNNFPGFDQMQLVFIRKSDIFYKVKNKNNNWSDWVLNDMICGNMIDLIYEIIIHVEDPRCSDIKYTVFFNENYLTCENGVKCGNKNENNNNDNNMIKKIQIIKNNLSSSYREMKYRIHIQNGNWTQFVSYGNEIGNNDVGFTAIHIKLT